MKNKIITILFITIIFGILVGSIFLKDIEISNFERRKLASFPKISEDFSEDLDEYLLDQFPFRNSLINLNSIINRKLLNKIDNNDVYVIENNIIEKNYPLNEKNCTGFINKINKIIDECDKNRVFYSVIPDKSYFLEGDKYLKLDYSKMYEILKSNIKADYIDITNLLELDDYYKTDIHWKQENLDKVVNKIIQSLGKEYKKQDYVGKEYKDFYGASYSKAGLDLPADNLKYLDTEYFNKVEVNHLEYGKKQIYDEEKLTNLDSYDVFLSGASSYIEIKNDNIEDNSSLILFRDSFASSIAPLLIPYYNNIKIVDLRYIDFDIAKEKIDLGNSDVLFLYSTLIINNSNILKIKFE